MRCADRVQQVQPFYAVKFAMMAHELSEQGRDIISMGIGEPDFKAPEPVVEALFQAMREGKSGYSSPLGIPQLREAIAQYYAQYYGVNVNPRRIIIMSGASGALGMATLALLNPGDEILMPDPSYPANSNFIRCAGGTPKLIPAVAESRFHLTLDQVKEHWGQHTRGILLASPSNPTGTSIAESELQGILEFVKSQGGLIFMDEIYLGLWYEQKLQTALDLDSDIIVINSFSKYFNMTGWRLGWLVVPESLVSDIEKLAGNITICACTMNQHAAVACFHPDTLALYEQRRLEFKARRDYLLPELEKLGLSVPVKPDGAFYIYADVSQHASDSQAFALDLLQRAGVVVTPGIDFGPHYAQRMIRLSYATSLDRLQEAVSRIANMLSM